MIQTKVIIEPVHWINASEQLPDAGSQVLVCYERNDCEERDVCVAVYDDSLIEVEGDSPWEVDGGLMCFGFVLYWAELPTGPARASA
jgi:hypothetical protein